MLKNKKNATDQAKEFMATNWYILWIVILIVFIHNFIVIGEVSDKYDAALEKIDKASKGVVMLDYSGRVVYVDKRSIDATNAGFKSAVSNALRFYLLKDWQTLSKNFTVNQIKTPEDIESNNADIVEFRDNYLIKDKDAFSDYSAYIKMLAYLISTDNMPEKTIATDTVVNSYSVVQNEFNIAITIKTVSSVYLIESDKTVDRAGEIVIKASGVFDPENGTAINPLGIRFKEVKPTYIKKR